MAAADFHGRLLQKCVSWNAVDGGHMRRGVSMLVEVSIIMKVDFGLRYAILGDG